MKTDNRIRNILRICTRGIPALVLAGGFFLAAGCTGIQYRVVKHKVVDTNGRARGVAAEGNHAFIADGDAGLKIFNISNPGSVGQVSKIDLPGFNAQVAVEGNIAVLSDTTQKCIYVVDISNVLSPSLKWTHKTLDVVRAIALQGGIAFLAVRGDDPTDESYFSGLEAVSCSLTAAPVSLKSAALQGVRDVAATSGYVYVVSSQSLATLARTASGFNSTPLATMSFGSTEEIQSLDCRAVTHLLVLGKSLYLVNVTTPSLPSISHSWAIPGSEQNRVITSAGIMPGTSGVTSPELQFVRFAYSTQKEYGYGMAELSSAKILFSALAVDVDKLSKGRIKVFDIEMHKDFASLFASGDVFAMGALDNHGLGCAY